MSAGLLIPWQFVWFAAGCIATTLFWGGLIFLAYLAHRRRKRPAGQRPLK